MSSTYEVLDLSAISPPRDRALIKTKANPKGLRPDGSEYELANLEDLSPVQLARFNALFTEAEALWTKPDGLTEAEAKRMEDTYTDLVTMLILDSARKDVAQLPTVARRAVVLGFWGALNEATTGAMGTRRMQAFGKLSQRAQAMAGSAES